MGILHSERPNISAEVIVSDDALESNAEALVAERFTWAKWMDGPKRGPAANRNNAVRNASGEWVVFIDDDCIPSARWLIALAVGAETEEYPVLEGKTVPQGRQLRADFDCPINLKGGNLWSCNFAIRRSVFLEIGGFDEKYPFPAMEDVDLCFRIRKKQFPIRFIADAVVEHPWCKKDMVGLRNRAKSLAYFIDKHPESEPIFLRTCGFRRMIRIIGFEFPKDVMRFGNKGTLQMLFLNLCFAFDFLIFRIRRRAVQLNQLYGHSRTYKNPHSRGETSEKD
jgi:GT2 family glycosyltransferase